MGNSETYFREDNHSSKFGGNFPYETRIGGEPLDIAFIATVEEDGSSVRARPVICINEVPLLVCRGGAGETEMVEILLKVPNLVMVLKCIGGSGGVDPAARELT